MHFDGKMKNNRRKIERGLGILPYGNSTTQTIGKCGGFRLCHDTGSACYECYRHSRRVCRYFNVGEKGWWIFFLNDKNRIQYNDQCKLSLIRKYMIKRREWEKGYLQGETVKSLRTGCQDFFIVRIVEADWHISIQSQRMGKYMTAIRHSGVADIIINIIHAQDIISRQVQ